MRECVWCGSQANSKEHVYPQWLREFDGPSRYIAKHGDFQDPAPQLVTDFTEEGELIEYEETRGRRTPNLHQVQVKAVCRECNNGWMADLEGGIKPLVRGLCRTGDKRSIAAVEQHELAVWAHKTFMMYDQHGPLNSRRYPTREYLDFYQNRTITSDTHIFIAKSRSPYAGFGMWSDSRSLIPVGVDELKYVREEGNNCGSSYFAVDGLVIFEDWFAPGYPQRDPTAIAVKRATLRKMSARGIHRIWPVPGPPLDWRRSSVLGQRRTEHARLALYALMARLPVLAKRVEKP